MKIGLLRKDDSESRAKIEAAEAAQEEADGRIKEAENRIRELRRRFTPQRSQLDEKTDQCARNVASCKEEGSHHSCQRGNQDVELEGDDPKGRAGEVGEASA